jgi:hypothetical protein
VIRTVSTFLVVLFLYVSGFNFLILLAADECHQVIFETQAHGFAEGLVKTVEGCHHCEHCQDYELGELGKTISKTVLNDKSLPDFYFYSAAVDLFPLTALADHLLLNNKPFHFSPVPPVPPPKTPILTFLFQV